VNVWIDAHLSPQVATWLRRTFAVNAIAVRDLGFRDASDHAIVAAAREAVAVVLTKDRDFVDILEHLGPPPPVLWVTCGNTSNIRLFAILQDAWPKALALLRSGETLVEISDRT
jgi:predicted nuclease of predicted toxin-antitoxin system